MMVVEMTAHIIISFLYSTLMFHLHGSGMPSPGWTFYSDLIYGITSAIVTLSETSKGGKNFMLVKC